MTEMSEVSSSSAAAGAPPIARVRITAADYSLVDQIGKSIFTNLHGPRVRAKKHHVVTAWLAGN